MHSPSALTEYVSLNLAGTFLLDPVQAGPHAYLDDVEDFLEHLVPRGGAVHEEALDSLLGLLLRPPLDEGLAYGNLRKGKRSKRSGF